ncbi:vacuolar ATP synthase F subunit [Aspergillus parasiticus SU-1]|uniref:V-type proton ATPase subunit F n=1 Tax=Aspergillus parasiticus (strain ATCC 56775 / NRRL 5862 / SRRC 143 / SU-1) TaxID=1403190 RepID=A0A0F0HZL7_ASPPU|nr:vacuolar ATP synthase F subunit [Aspergillus parasiticus SU-1]
MAAQAKDRQFLAVIGDEDSVTGLLLAGVGVSGFKSAIAADVSDGELIGFSKHVTDPPDSQRNFLVVDSKTETSTIEKTFQNFTQERKDIAIVLINQHFVAVLTREQVAERIRHSVDSFADPFPAVLEIPSKDHPYDPEKDSVLKRVRRLFGE